MKAHARRIVSGRYALFLLALACFIGWLAAVPDAFTGDEPEYLFTADSIVRFHTLDLRSAYDDPSGVRRLAPDLPERLGVDVTGDGRLPPIRGVGFAILLAPVWWATGSLTAVRLFLGVVAALLVHQTAGLLRDLAPGERNARLAVVAGVCLTLPLLAFSTQLYPEVAGALCLVASLRCCLRISRRPRAAIAAASFAALMPWLHPRYALLSAGLGVLVGCTVLRQAHERGEALVRRLPSLAPVLVVVGISALGIVLLSMHLYESPFPLRAYQTPPAMVPQQTFPHRWALSVGSLLSPTEGLVTWAPFFAIALVGIDAARRWLGAASLWIGLIALAHLTLVVPLGFFGTDLPARFTIVLLPIFAVAALAALRSVPALVLPSMLLIVLSTVLTVQGARHYVLLYLEPASIAPVDDVIDALPWSWETRGEDEVVLDANTVAWREAEPNRSREIAWPPVLLRKARYHVRLDLAQDLGSDARLVINHGHRVLLQHTVTSEELRRRRVEAFFDTPDYETAIRVTLQTVDARIPTGGLSIERIGAAESRDARIRSTVPQGIAALSLAAIGAALVGQLGRRRDRWAHPQRS